MAGIGRMVAAVVLVAGCVAELPPTVAPSVAAASPSVEAVEAGGLHPGQLDGTTWTLTFIDDQEVDRPKPVTFAFTDGHVLGDTGCNGFSARYTYQPSDGALLMGPMTSTLMLCANEVKAFERDVERYVATTRELDLDAKGRLIFVGPNGRLVLTGR